MIEEITPALVFKFSKNVITTGTCPIEILMDVFIDTLDV